MIRSWLRRLLGLDALVKREVCQQLAGQLALIHADLTTLKHSKMAARTLTKLRHQLEARIAALEQAQGK